MKSGIYKIINLVNGKFYIGSAENLKFRKAKHFSALRKGIHHSKHLQSSFNKHGEKAFEFRIVEYCEINNLILREQYYLDFQLCAQHYIAGISDYFLINGYNMNPVAGSSKGRKFNSPSKEIRDKISKGNKGIVKSVEWRLNLSKALTGKTGRKLSKKHIESISMSHRGKIKTKEHILNYRIGRSRSITQLTLDYIPIKDWNGCSFAAKELGLSQTAIWRVCKGIRKKYAGFRWRFI